MKKHTKLEDSNICTTVCSSSTYMYDSDQELNELTYHKLHEAISTFRNPTKLYEVKKHPGSGYFSVDLKSASLVDTDGDYKIHISVKNTELARAWNIIVRVLYNKKIASFKVHDGDIQGFQEGKNIVIYTDIFDDKPNFNNLEKWKALLRTIDNYFIENKIIAGKVSCFRFNNTNSKIPEPKFEEVDYCYIRRFVKPEPSCCGLCKKSEKSLIKEMTDLEKLGLFNVSRKIVRPTVSI